MNGAGRVTMCQVEACAKGNTRAQGWCHGGVAATGHSRKESQGTHEKVQVSRALSK